MNKTDPYSFEANKAYKRKILYRACHIHETSIGMTSLCIQPTAKRVTIYIRNLQLNLILNSMYQFRYNIIKTNAYLGIAILLIFIDSLIQWLLLQTSQRLQPLEKHQRELGEMS